MRGRYRTIAVTLQPGDESFAETVVDKVVAAAGKLGVSLRG